MTRAIATAAARWLFAAAVSLALVGVAAASDDRDLTVDRAMGVLDPDPVLDRVLTEAPEPWPAPRGEQPFDQQPPGAQEGPEKLPKPLAIPTNAQ